MCACEMNASHPEWLGSVPERTATVHGLPVLMCQTWHLSPECPANIHITKFTITSLINGDKGSADVHIGHRKLATTEPAGTSANRHRQTTHVDVVKNSTMNFHWIIMLYSVVEVSACKRHRYPRKNNHSFINLWFYSTYGLRLYSFGHSLLFTDANNCSLNYVGLL